MNSLPTILVTGANGQLGQEFRKLASSKTGFQWLFATRGELPVEDSALVTAYFNTHSFDYCINCAAYTAVDKAEDEKDAAFLVNARGAGLLAEACKLHDRYFISISTDYVFDGNSKEAYKEDDPTGPLNIYGASKLKGEEFIMQANPESIIIRTSWLYATAGNNFVNTMLRLMKEKKDISVVDDQKGSPTFAGDLANAILTIISSGKWVPGIFHFCNKGITSWFGFAEEIRKIAGVSSKLIPITTEEYPRPAKRPKNSVLSTERIERVYNMSIPGWKESLGKMLAMNSSAPLA